MESASAELEEDIPQQDNSRRKKGGIITIPFIIANEAFEKVASIGLQPNMILYLMKDYQLKFTKGQNILFIWGAASNFTPVVGAFVSDSYLGRFLGIALGSLFSFLGMAFLWLTAMIPQARPPPCDPISKGTCKSASRGQLALLIFSFVLMSIGAGGVRYISLGFGADQLDRKDNPNNQRVLESYFGWYYGAASIAIMIALTGVVYIQDHLGWKVGFGVPALCMFVSGFLFILASPLYIKRKENKNLIRGFAQVMVAAYKNRKLAVPALDSLALYHRNKDSNYIKPSDKLRFLNKACIIKCPEKDVAPDGSASDPWRLCTIEQVEEVKALIKVIPIWSTGIIYHLTLNIGSFQLLQANSMNRHLTSGFQVPGGSFTLFTPITIMVWVVLYDRIIIPLATKVKGRPVSLGAKHRVGIGLCFGCLSMVVGAIIETARKNKAIREGYLNNPHAMLDMSAFWLVPQLCLAGLAEAFNMIGQMEFYYTEFPKTMSSIASSLAGFGFGVSNLVATAVMNSVDELTSRGGKESWVSDNINKGHFNYYYWLLAALSFMNVLYFVVCSWLYGSCGDGDTKVRDEATGTKEERVLDMGTKEHMKEEPHE